MTAPDDTGSDPVAAYVRALSPKLRTHLNITETVVTSIHAASRRGWTTQQLIDATTHNHGGAWNTGAIIAHRLAEKCAVLDPPDSSQAARLIPLCGHCDHGWIYNEQTDPPTQTRCPCRAPQEATV